MNQIVCVVEAYVPGLGQRTEDWYERLQSNVAAAVCPDGLMVALLGIPNDETLMWLVWGRLDQPDPTATIAPVVLREAATAGGAAVIERAASARLIWSRSDPGGLDIPPTSKRTGAGGGVDRNPCGQQ